jgi:hypothetical protein
MSTVKPRKGGYVKGLAEKQSGVSNEHTTLKPCKGEQAAGYKGGPVPGCDRSSSELLAQNSRRENTNSPNQGIFISHPILVSPSPIASVDKRINKNNNYKGEHNELQCKECSAGVECEIKGGHTHYSSHNRSGYASRIKNEGKGPTNPDGPTKVGESVKPSGDKVTPHEEKKPRWHHCDEGATCLDMACHGHVIRGARLNMETDSFSDYLARHPNATKPEIAKALLDISKQSSAIFGPPGAEWDDEVKHMDEGFVVQQKPSVVTLDNFDNQSITSYAPQSIVETTAVVDKTATTVSFMEEAKTELWKPELPPRLVVKTGFTEPVVKLKCFTPNPTMTAFARLGPMEHFAGVARLDDQGNVRWSPSWWDEEERGKGCTVHPSEPHSPGEEKKESYSWSESDGSSAHNPPPDCPPLSGRSPGYTPTIVVEPVDEVFEDTRVCETIFHPTPEMGEGAMAPVVKQTEHSLVKLPESWEEGLYGGVGDNTPFMLETSMVYVFSQQATAGHDFSRMTLVKHWLAENTFLGAIEKVLPVNDGPGILSEEKVADVKTRVAARWVWEETFAANTTRETFHAFKACFTHSSEQEVYHNIAAHFISTPQFTRGRIMKDNTSAVLLDTAVGFLTQYMAQHPLLGVMNLRPLVRINTEKHIMNQMIVIGLERRSAMPNVEDGAGGLIDAPYHSSVFGRNKHTAHNHHHDVTTYGHKTSIPGKIEQSFRSRVPSKTESPRGSPTVSGLALATIFEVLSIVATAIS